MSAEGNYTGESFSSKQDGVNLFGHRWEPEGTPKGVIFLFHGLHSHTFFEYMEMGEQYRNKYEGSLVEKFNKMGLVVCAMDARGHGRSAGYRAVTDFQQTYEDAEQFIDSVTAENAILCRLPIFLLGMSMGGLFATNIGLRRPDKYKGLVLVSPALEKHEDVKPPMQNLLLAIAEPLVWLFPRLELVKIPPAKNELIHEQFMEDPLTWKGMCVAKTAYEFIKAFEQLKIEEINTPVIMIFGAKDHVVGTERPKVMFDKISATDKELKTLESIWHDPLHEDGFEQTREIISEWISKRLK